MAILGRFIENFLNPNKNHLAHRTSLSSPWNLVSLIRDLVFTGIAAEFSAAFRHAYGNPKPALPLAKASAVLTFQF